MNRILTVFISAAILATASGVAGTAAQEANAADISGAFTIPVPDNSMLRITSPRMETCAEIPLGVSVVSYKAVVTTGAKCQLSPGDALGFWLIYPNGGIELLAPATGTLAPWAPGSRLSVDLGRVPCADPCPPPEAAGAADPGVTLPPTGTGASGASQLPLTALALLVFPAALAVLTARRRRG